MKALTDYLHRFLRWLRPAEESPLNWTLGWMPADNSITTARIADDAISGGAEQAGFERAYEQMAEHLGKTTLELTADERKQARANEVTRWILCGTLNDEAARYIHSPLDFSGQTVV